MTRNFPDPPPLAPRPAVLLLGALGALATLALYARPVLFPMLSQDDFPILAHSWTWERTKAALWVPNNEHAMPLGRLWTFLVVRLAGGAAGVPRAGVLAGVGALLLALPLLYLLVRRELG